MSGDRKPTRQQRALREAMRGVEEFRSAQQIHALLEASGTSMGLATVYRNLHTLTEDGQLESVRTDDGEVRYRACVVEAHHHHLLCRDCGRAVDLVAPAVERWAGRVAADHGYTRVEHQVEIVGVCPDCAGPSTLDPHR